MSSYTPDSSMAGAATSANELNARSAGLHGWNATGYDALKFSHGLAGVNQVDNYLWTNILLYAFFAIGGLTLVLRITNMWLRHMRHISVMSNPQRQVYWAMNQTTWWPWLDRHLFTAPFWNKRHNKAFQLSSAIDNGTMPGRWHTLILTIYVSCNIAWMLVLPWHEKETKSVVASLRGRSGMLAALNLMPTVLFALRNNPLITLLQVSYDDFNLFHRWAARITILEALVHTGAWTYNTAHGMGWKEIGKAIAQEESYGWGMVGTIAFTILGIQAWSPIRHAFYETFLNIHRFMVLVSLVGVYIHLERHGLPQVPWLQLVFIFWGGEWAIRFFTTTYHGFSLKKRSRVTVEAMPGEACRVTIDMVRPWTPRPGCNVHIYMPALALWSSHPFSVAWSPPMSPPLESKEMTLPTLEGEAIAPMAARKSNQISLICRARTGLTRKMYEKAAKSPNEKFTTFGFIEGPYGGHHSLDSYGTVLLFAGGVGITHQVMYIKHLVDGFHHSKTATQKIVLIWTVPDAECLEWVRPWMDEILRMPGRKKCLRVKLFISRPKNRIENNSETVRMFAGRPKTATLLEEEIKNRVGAMAITVCGSGPFADDVRAAVRPNLEEGAIDFIEEAFTY
jgi:predicted ferric reductase